MGQSYYSWMGTKIHLLLDDDLASNYNQAQDKFEAAQLHHMDTWNEPWNPTTDPLLMNWTPDEQKAWNAIARVINILVQVNGGSLAIPEEEVTSNHLELL